jgi:REP element-mobilizing transposase RayT
MMHVRLVFVTTFRHKVFADAHLRRTKEIMRSVCTDFECDLVEFNGEGNHVHLLVNFPPKVAVTKLVNSLKGVSSRRLPRRHCQMRITTGLKADAVRMNSGSPASRSWRTLWGRLPLLPSACPSSMARTAQLTARNEDLLHDPRELCAVPRHWPPVLSR